MPCFAFKASARNTPAFTSRRTFRAFFFDYLRTVSAFFCFFAFFRFFFFSSENHAHLSLTHTVANLRQRNSTFVSSYFHRAEKKSRKTIFGTQVRIEKQSKQTERHIPSHTEFDINAVCFSNDQEKEKSELGFQLKRIQNKPLLMTHYERACFSVLNNKQT